MRARFGRTPFGSAPRPLHSALPSHLTAAAAHLTHRLIEDPRGRLARPRRRWMDGRRHPVSYLQGKSLRGSALRRPKVEEVEEVEEEANRFWGKRLSTSTPSIFTRAARSCQAVNSNTSCAGNRYRFLCDVLWTLDCLIYYKVHILCFSTASIRMRGKH